MAINYRDIVHPEDESALRQLENTTGVKLLAEKLVSIGAERYLHNQYMADCLRLGPQQLPEIYERLLPIVHKFGIPEPEFYLQQTPVLNAWTAGDKKPFIVVTSGLVSALKKEEFDSVVAHECGHILCHHCLYKTVLSILQLMLEQTSQGISASVPGLNLLAGPVLSGAYYAANYWSRRSEYSADRASVIFTGDELITQKALLRIHAGPSPITDNVNLEAYIEQSKQIEEEQADSSWDKFLSMLLIKDRSHPFGTTRLAEIRKWANSAQYRTVLANLDKPYSSLTCPNCNHEIDGTWKFCRYCGQKVQ